VVSTIVAQARFSYAAKKEEPGKPSKLRSAMAAAGID
jgi:hypothetical protein